MRILVVEDDSRIASFVRRGLREEDYTVDVGKDGEEGLFLAQTNDYDLIILDLVMPKRGGLEVLRELRADKVTTPVLILTGKGKPDEKVAGLDTGADDYLQKPFNFDELLARVRALLRRRGDLVPTALRAADLELDVLRHKASRGGRELVLTSREFSLLEHLLRHQNQVVTRTMLSEHVWEHDFDPMSNVINVTMVRLRQKIDDGSKVKLLQTIRGRGYMLQAPETPATELGKAERRPDTRASGIPRLPRSQPLQSPEGADGGTPPKSKPSAPRPHGRVASAA